MSVKKVEFTLSSTFASNPSNQSYNFRVLVDELNNLVVILLGDVAYFCFQVLKNMRLLWLT